MHASDSYLMILDGEREKALRQAILLFGEEGRGAPEEGVKVQLSSVTDLHRLRRMIRRAATAATWQEILETA